MSDVKILLEFNDKRRVFQDPLKVLSCHELEKVEIVLQQAEELRRQGYWVVGFLSYEAGYAFEGLAALSPKKRFDLPLVWFAVFKRYTELQDEVEQGGAPGSKVQLNKLKLAQRWPEYKAHIGEIKELIEQGTVYQINYTTKYDLLFSGDDFALYQELKRKQRTDYSAYIQTKAFSILSLSPELFFHLKNGKILVKPMKGTCPRGVDPADDKARASTLHHDPKNRAENLMIVDLLRNDLGKICRAGTVRSSELFAVEKYQTLWQMTSTVTGQLKKSTGLPEVIRELFPSGSVTGAPKIQAMKEIRRLEQRDRGIYTGAIGYLSPEETVFNVAIRTVLLRRSGNGHQGELGVGGGITYPSNAKEEYQEMLLKGEFLRSKEPPFRLIETMLWEKGRIFLERYHWQRLKRSAGYFGFKYELKTIKRVLKEAERAGLDPHKSYRLRLLLGRNGEVRVQSTVLLPAQYKGRAVLSPYRIDPRDKFLYHKTTYRQLYEQEHAKALEQGCDDAIFCNERGEVTEGAITNVIIQINGKKYTPPLSSGLLPGIYREYLLKAGQIKERTLYLEDLKGANVIYLANSVRKIWPVKLVLR